MTTSTPAPFVFDRDYSNLDQVAHLWDAYTVRHQELASAGRYPYNIDFKGKIDGLVADDKNEDTAIYLLQVTRHIREHEARVQALRDQGYEELQVPPEGHHQIRHGSVALVGRQYHQGRDGTVQVIDAARVVTCDGEVTAVLPKGARSRGYRVGDGYVLVKQ